MNKLNIPIIEYELNCITYKKMGIYKYNYNGLFIPWNKAYYRYNNYGKQLIGIRIRIYPKFK
jgi:hypothetical protein